MVDEAAGASETEVMFRCVSHHLLLTALQLMPKRTNQADVELRPSF